MKMQEAGDKTQVYRSEAVREAAVLFDQIGYDEKWFEDVYRVACSGIHSAPSKADGISLALSAFKDAAHRESLSFFGAELPPPHRIWKTLDALQKSWPTHSGCGKSRVLSVLADDQLSCPLIVEEAQGVAARWAELVADQLRMIPSLRLWRNAQVQLLACELVAAMVSGYRLSMTYRNHLHFHRVLDHWRYQLSSATPSHPS